VGEGRRGLAPVDGRADLYELVVGQGVDHEQREVGASRHVALEQRVADVVGPHRQALALAFLEVRAPDDRPAAIAVEDGVARADLVADVRDAEGPRNERHELDDEGDLERVAVLAIEGDVPAAREDEAGVGLREVEHRLGGPRRVVVEAHGREDGEDALAALDRARDDRAIVGAARQHGDATTEAIELAHALRATDAHDLVAAVQAVLDHVLTELSRRADDADLVHVLLRGAGAPPLVRRALCLCGDVLNIA
jgi:hypothetical protein